MVCHMRAKWLMICLVCAAQCMAQAGRTSCRVEGVVEGTEECVLLIMPDGATDRTGRSDTIPVVDGRFVYDLCVSEPTVWWVRQYGRGGICNAGVRFFATDDTIRIDFHPVADERKPTVSCGSSLNVGLQRADSAFNAAKNETRKRYSDSADCFNSEEYLRYNRECQKITFRYAEANPTLVGLYYLVSLTRDVELDSTLADGPIESLFNAKYARLFPRHGMSMSLRRWIASRSLHVGGRFIDFTAPDADGQRHTLSEEISGRYALIDLWASWCGPCRKTSVSMIPVYNKYRDSGFTIVGVARERSMTSFLKALERDGYPWLSLVDVDDVNGIWELYGKTYAAGGTYLVDRDGIIVAVDPKVEEVEAILSKAL